MPDYNAPIITGTPYQLQQLNYAMQQPTTQGYTFLGQLWRNAVTNLTGGVIDVMGISQHNREIKATGGDAGNALLSALGSAVVAGQNQFLNNYGTYGSAEDSIKAGVVSEYIKKYFPWLILGVGVVTAVIVLLFKRKK